jgi:23S rRNA-/tRNA-specific pseudouridylate synthase
MLFAKNKAFAKAAMNEFTAGRVKKRYLARVHGVPKQKTIRIDAPVRRKKGFVFEAGEHLRESRPAVTDVTIRNILSDNTTVVECNPVTGRTHQIRLHLKHWGYPIVDDPIYGPMGDDSGSTLQSGAISLLSAALEVPELGISFSLQEYKSFLG